MFRRILLVLPIAAAFLFAAPVPASAEVNDFEREVMRLINQERANRGRAALGSDIRLWDAAERHNDWMCQTQRLSHIGSGGSTVATRISAQGYRWRALGETIAQGYGSPAAVVAGWRGSSPHWNILMSSSYRDIGVAYQACPGRARRHYWNVDVANSSSAAQPIGGGGGTTNPTATPQPSVTPRASATPRPSATTRPPAEPTDKPPASPPPPTSPPPPSGGNGAINGQVRIEGRSSAAGTLIYVDGRYKTTLGADGLFTVRDVAPGSRIIHARKSGWLDSGAYVSVQSGRTTAIGATSLRAGDFVVNNRVDYTDFRELVAWWGRCDVTTRADVDGDGCVGYSDYLLLRRNYGRRGATSWTTR